MKKKCVDLSAWNEPKGGGYSTLFREGVECAILKAIRKDLNPDKRFELHLKGCKEAGINVLGTYHYTYATTVQYARRCAKKWIRIVNGRCKKFYLDWEDKSLPTDHNAVLIILAYAEEITKAGYEFYIYTGQYLYNTVLKKYASEIPYDFWIARYYAGYELFNPGDEPKEKYRPVISNGLAGWQYTSSFNTVGFVGRLDMSEWYREHAFAEEKPISPMFNPYTVPNRVVKLGTMGNDANWILWCLWRFGLLLDEKGTPDFTRINGMIEEKDVELLKIAQERLGLVVDGKAGPKTINVFLKYC